MINLHKVGLVCFPWQLPHTRPTFVIRVIMYTLPSIQIVVNSDISHSLKNKPG